MNLPVDLEAKDKSRQIKKTCGLGVPLESPVEFVPASLHKFCLLTENVLMTKTLLVGMNVTIMTTAARIMMTIATLRNLTPLATQLNTMRQTFSFYLNEILKQQL